MKVLSGLLTTTILLVQFQLVLPVVLKAQDQSGVVERMLKKSMTVASSFPLKQRIIAQCQIAVECERLKKSTTLWNDTKDLIVSADKGKRDELWMEFGRFKAKVGDNVTAAMVIEKIVNERSKNEARRLYCQIYSDQGELLKAWDLAIAIEKRNRLRFYAMESLLLAAAEAGDSQMVAKASRSMDPMGADMMKRKLLDLCFVAAEYLKNDEAKLAKDLVASMAVFVQVLEDPALDSMVALLKVASEEDEFEELLRDTIDKLDDEGEETRVERADLLSALVDRLEVDRLAARLLDDYSDREFGVILMVRLADRFASNNDWRSFDHVASNMGESQTVAEGLIRRANSLGASGDRDQASKHLAAAQNMVSALGRQMDRSKRFQLKSMSMAHQYVYGNQDEVQELMESDMRPAMIFQTCLEVLRLQ